MAAAVNEPAPSAPRGLYDKFVVERTDGTSAHGEKHHACRYFVLDLDHDPFARAAIEAYIDACDDEKPNVAEDLRVKVLGV